MTQYLAPAITAVIMVMAIPELIESDSDDDLFFHMVSA